MIMLNAVTGRGWRERATSRRVNNGIDTGLVRGLDFINNKERLCLGIWGYTATT